MMQMLTRAPILLKYCWIGVHPFVAPGKQGVQFLSLPEILADGIALGYFFDYLRKARALKNLQFWLACAQLLELAETSHEGKPARRFNLQPPERARGHSSAGGHLTPFYLDSENALLV